jgi:NitT/TauT family transport system permease protein
VPSRVSTTTAAMSAGSRIGDPAVNSRSTIALRRRFSGTALPVAWGVLVLAAWELFVKWRDIKPFLLPAPSAIWAELWKDKDRLFDDNQKTLFLTAARSTATNALVGLAAGVVLAMIAAMVAQRFRLVRELVRPVSAAFNTMPIVALGPVFYNMLGATSDAARRVVVALVAFFPVFVNLVSGLTQVDPVHQELMRSYAASDTAFMRKVRLPNALPFLMTGIRIAASLSVIAAVVVEYFGGKQNGLGARVASAMKLSQTPKAWGYITVAILTGLAFYLAGLVLELLVLPWQAKRKLSDA